MKSLPVPPLTQTLERYARALSAISTAEEVELTRGFIDEFLADDGPKCQSELEEFAVSENENGHNWMSQAWLAGYLGSRDPLPLVSNVTFELAFDSKTNGIERASEIIYRLASIYLTQLRGEAPADISPRGDELSPTQWHYLNGAIREPKPDIDGITDGPKTAANREIVVLYRNNAYAITISDTAGQPIPHQILASQLAETVKTSSWGNFTDLSYLGSATASELLPKLLADPKNVDTYTHLQQCLFIAELADEDIDSTTALTKLMFEPGHGWVYKPSTYQISLTSDFVAVHFEHSLADGATLKELVSRAQKVELVDTAAKTDAKLLPLNWVLSDELSSKISSGLAGYTEQISNYQVRQVMVDFEFPAGYKLSADAAMQWVMAYAQYATWGRFRSHYEAVDMREYLAGRTECLRSLTPEAADLVTALRQDAATIDQLLAAKKAHSDWVKACKSGNGIDRHLLGLRLMAEKLGLSPKLFADQNYRRLGTDLLSTTSVGDKNQITRFTFAPPKDGIGVYYVANKTRFEYLLSWRIDQRPDVETFIQNLDRGATKLAALVAKAAQ